jgi:hypothetical protein
MELLLNLAWLTLAVSAALVGIPACRVAPSRAFLGRLHSAVVLGSILVLVFPFISVTDDLMALRTDIEESGSSNRTVKAATADASDSRGLPSFNLLPVRTGLSGPQNETWSDLSLLSAPCADRVLLENVGSRAPPLS